MQFEDRKGLQKCLDRAKERQENDLMWLANLIDTWNAEYKRND